MEGQVRTGKVFLHRNAMGQAHRSAIAARSSIVSRDETVIFYGSGTKAHKRDFAELAGPALSRLFAKYGARVRLVLTGFQGIPAVLAPFEHLIECRPPIWEVGEYWRTLAAADINLAVLARSEATDSKSEIKWMEAAMLGVPSVLSRSPNYEDTVENGVTGFLVDTPEEWFVALDALIGDRELRQRVGDAAREAVMARYNEEVMAQNLARMMESVSPAAPVAAERKRILFVNVFYPPQAIGGATRVMHDNVRELMARHGDSYDIEVFASAEGEPEPYKLRSYAIDGARVSVVSTPSGAHVSGRALDPEMGRIFTQFLASCQPDLIHFHCVQRLTASLLTAAKAFDIPYVVTAHDGWWISERQFLTDDLGRIEVYADDDDLNAERFGAAAAARARELRTALSGAKRILAVSESFAKIYRDAGFDNVLAIPNGVSTLPEARRRPSPDGRVRLGYVGGMEPHKGYPLVQAAIRRGEYENLSLTVVDHSRGVGDDRHELWGSTPVTFVGRRAQDQVGELYGGLDVLLAPSVWPESYGLVTREALACGLWVVASDRGAVGEDVVAGENGFIIDVQSTRGLEEALAAIDANPLKFRAPPARKVSLRRSTEQADDLASLYGELLSPQQAGA